MKIILTVLLVCSFAAGISSAIPQYASTIRSPSYPLAVRTPYASIWMPSNKLPGTWPTFWTGQAKGWLGLIRVDGKTYEWMGAISVQSGTPVRDQAEQTSVTTTPTQTIYSLTAGGVNLTVTFLSPVEYEDVKRQSIPLSYVFVGVQSNDGASHSVQLYCDITGEWAAGDLSQTVEWALNTQSTLKLWSTELQTQYKFGEYNDYAQWGRAVFATSNDATHRSGSDTDVRRSFVENGWLDNSHDDSYRCARCDWPTFAFAHNVGEVGDTEKMVQYVVGYIREDLINLKGNAQKALWTHYFTNWAAMVSFFYEDAANSKSTADVLDTKILNDAFRAEGQAYADVVSFSLRQAYGATELGGTPSSPLLYLKEISSNGNMQTVDVMYPATPLFYYLNVDYLKYLLQPLFNEMEGGFWPREFSIHDIGTHYPNATGHEDGIEEDMPVEESANMILMVGNIAFHPKARLNEAKAYVQSHYEILSSWANYLHNHCLYPIDQLTTDDFIGETELNSGLALKGILAIKTFAKLASLIGDVDAYSKYTEVANEFILTWVSESMHADGSHLKMEYHVDNGYQLKYNAFQDKLLALGMVPETIYKLEADYYLTKEEAYGIPFVSTRDFTKSDWEIWTAAAFGHSNKTLRTNLVADLSNFLKFTPFREPFSDWYVTATSLHIGFRARPVVGGHFAILALNDTIPTADKSASAVIGYSFIQLVTSNSIELKNQTIPSGIYSALEEGKLTDSILMSYNDVNLRWIGKDNWTYSMIFDAPAEVDNLTVVLVFHGIDTSANIYLNDLELGKANNMFVRYRFNLNGRVKATNNSLRVEFQSPIYIARRLSTENKITPPECPPTRYHGECHVNFLRKMQASFSWDWGLAAPSMGLWKKVQLEVYDSAIIRDITYHLDEKEMWVVYLTIHFETGAEKNASIVEGNLTIEVKELLDSPINTRISTTPDESGEFSFEISFQVPKKNVRLWWPNGYGDQCLYTLTASWESAFGRTNTNTMSNVDRKLAMSSKSIRIGFRTIELIEEPTDGGLSFYFMINKLPIFMKGTNWIPLHILPEKSANKTQIEYYFKAMKMAHMNMIRVWGGGLYESDDFYNLADEYGILIWQDMMFACAMYPVFDEFLRSVKEEIKQNIRRLQSHACIALWAGNNENEAALRENWYNTSTDYNRFADEYVKLYNDTVANEVYCHDKWHIWLYSSPSNGKKRMNGSIIEDNPQDWHYGDIHYYNYIADGWSSNTYPRPRFVSEYGFQSIPSLNSWKSVQGSADGDLSALVDHRQHFPFGSAPILAMIGKNLPAIKENDAMYLETLIYFSQISQAMTIKAETEVYRIEQDGFMNTMGALYWQLNDVWVAPSWSSIEFNGNYKIAHHFAKKFFAPTALAIIVDATNHINVHIVRDNKSIEENFHLTMRVYCWSSLKIQYAHTWNYTATINRSVENVARFHVDAHLMPPLTKHNAVMEFILTKATEDDRIISSNFIFPEKIKNAVGVMDPHIKVKNIQHNSPCSSDGYRTVTFDVVIEAPSIFVYIQIQHDSISQYVLTDNGFMQFQQSQAIGANFYDPTCSLSIAEQNIHILTVNKFMN